MRSNGVVIGGDVVSTLRADPLELDATALAESAIVRVVPFLFAFRASFEAFVGDDAIPADVVVVVATIL